MRHLIFDIDGTLWNTTAVVAVAWNEAVRESGLTRLSSLVVTDKMLQKEFGKPMDVIADDLFGDIEPDKKALLLKNCCRLEHKAIEDNEKDLTYPLVRETLRKLSKTNKIYIVSNCQDGYIELVIKKNGLDDIITDYECFGHTGLQKDENIRLMMERNNIADDEASYIGDTNGDYVATKKAGIEFVFAKYGFGEVDTPDKTISKFEELLDLWQ